MNDDTQMDPMVEGEEAAPMPMPEGDDADVAAPEADPAEDAGEDDDTEEDAA